MAGEVARLGVEDLVTFDARYIATDELRQIVQTADIVLLPYDSLDQVTSGVLVEAVTAGKPVVSTGFPHARELLSGGAGLIVPRRDSTGYRGGPTSSAHRTGSGGSDVGRGPATGTVTHLVRRSAAVPRPRCRNNGSGSRAGQCVSATTVSFEHVVRLSDETGLFEHAETDKASSRTRVLRR